MEDGAREPLYKRIAHVVCLASLIGGVLALMFLQLKTAATFSVIFCAVICVERRWDRMSSSARALQIATIGDTAALLGTSLAFVAIMWGSFFGGMVLAIGAFAGIVVSAVTKPL